MCKLQSSRPTDQLSVEQNFAPHPLLFRSGHLMTAMPALFPRYFGDFRKAGVKRIFQVSPDTCLLGWCHFHNEPQLRFTAVVVHGLEGSSESAPMLGLANKAFNSGMNVVRINLRNCGGSMHLTPTLYNAGHSCDVLAVCRELSERDGLQDILLAGYSLGGNIVLNAAVEGSGLNLIRSVVGVSPSIDLHRCVRSIEQPKNSIYEQFFLRTLKKKVLKKSLSHPSLYDTKLLKQIRSMRQFDDLITAPNGGYSSGDDYYHRTSACHTLPRLSVPALIIAAKDDPIVPFDSFADVTLINNNIRLLVTTYGGHAGFVNATREDHLFDEYWAENRTVAFFKEVISQIQAR